MQAKDEGLTLQQSFDWSNGLFEISWSDKNEDLMVTASGDGSVQLWKTFQSLSQPVMCYKEHSLEASSVDWNNHLIASGSWDQTVKIVRFLQLKEIIYIIVNRSQFLIKEWSSFTVAYRKSCGRVNLHWTSKYCTLSEMVSEFFQSFDQLFWRQHIATLGS